MSQTTTTSAFETAASKEASGENFPVGSFLLPKRLRPHVAVFYAFARAADDIGDDPVLPAEEKIRRLDAFEDVLLGRREQEPGLEKPWRVRQSLIQCGVTTVLPIISFRPSLLTNVCGRSEGRESPTPKANVPRVGI